MSTAAPVVPEVEPKQPVAPAAPAEPAPSIYKDENRDVSAEAFERNELGIKNNIQQTPSFVAGEVAPEPKAPAAVEPPAAAPAPVEPKEEKLLAGKYKTAEELEKGYIESQKGFTQKVEAEVQKRVDAAVNEKLKEKGLQLAEQTETAQHAVTKSLSQMSNDELLDLQVNNPQEFIRKQQEATLQSIRASQVQEAWRRDNKDLLEMQLTDDDGGDFTGEFLVSNMTLALAKKRPDLLADGTGEALLKEATGRVRNFIAAQRNQGKQEALVVRETVTPLQATTRSSTTAPGNQPAPPAAAAEDADPAQAEVERLRAEQKRVSGGNAQIRY